MNILKRADDIVNHRSEEKDRQYGGFTESLGKTAALAQLITGKPTSIGDVFAVLIALKLSRESYGHKEDNLLDAVAYIGALNNYHNRTEGGTDAV